MSLLSGFPTTTIPDFSSGSLLPSGVPNGSGVTSVPSESFTSVGAGFDIATFVTLFVEVLVFFLALSLIGVLIIVVVANRADPDPRGRRPQTVFYFAVSFVALGIAIAGSTAVVAGIDALVGNHAHAVTNAAGRAILVGALATVVSLALLVVHLRRGLGLAGEDPETPGPSRRVAQSYVSAVAFIAVLAMLVLFVFSVYLIFTLAAPGVFGTFGGQANDVHVLVVALYLWVVAWAVLSTHRRLVTPELDFFGTRRGSAHGSGTPETPPVAGT